MEISRANACQRSAVIYYPVFPAEWQNTNGFYLRLADEAKSAAEKIGSNMRYYADFSLSDTDGTISVTYVIRAKHMGKTERTKTFTHIWKDDKLIKVIKSHK